MDPTEIAKIVKAAPELARDAYNAATPSNMKGHPAGAKKGIPVTV
jgi:hypothetical protein